MFKVGDEIAGRYKLLKKLGQGGEGEVFLAKDMSIDKRWVVKFIYGKDETVKRDSELLLLKDCNHPSLPRIVEGGECKGIAYIVRDYIEGVPLSNILEKEGSIKDIPRVLSWFKELVGVLSYLHSMNPKIIYGDMKPENIIVMRNGRVSLVDFGISFRGNQESGKKGSIAYAAPEQFLGKRINEKTDIYNLGAVMLRVLTGKTVSSISLDDQKKVPGRLWKIIEKCIRKNPKMRYRDCRELFRDLENYGRCGKDYETYKRMKRMPYYTAAIVLSGILLLAVLFYDAKKTDEKIEDSRIVEEEFAYKVAVDCMENLEDYSKASFYFEKLKDDSYPEGKYLKKTALMLCGSENLKDIEKTLKELEDIADSIDEKDRKAFIYRILALSYARKGGYEEASSDIVRICEKGIETGRDGYIFDQYLIPCYMNLGDGCYEKALCAADNLTDYAKENPGVESLLGTDLLRWSLLKKAEIYLLLSDEDKAEEIFVLLIDEYSDADAYFTYMNFLFENYMKRDGLAEKTNTKEELSHLYQKALSLKNVTADYRWKEEEKRYKEMLRDLE